MFLEETCNGLEYFLAFEPKSYRVIGEINCNTSYTYIIKLNAKESFEFSTNIVNNENSEPLKDIGLFFVKVDRYVSLDTLKKYPKIINDIYKQANESNVIWSKKE